MGKVSAHQFPYSPHHVLRCFGVDATATAAARGLRVRSIIDKRSKYFVACGVSNARPAFAINLDTYIAALQIEGKLVLTEQSLVERVYNAMVGSAYYGSWHETDGISFWMQHSLHRLVHDCLRPCCPVKKEKILVVVLTPFESLSASDSSQRTIRRDEQDIS